jgi:class 3 adenylate cyclase
MSQHLTPEMRERRLTIVLLDLIGSTAFVERVGPMQAARWLQYHDRLARSLLYRYDGREIDRSDGFLLSFERSIDALNFALHYQRDIPPKTRLNTRIGIHVGDVVEVTQHELEIMGGAKPIELEGVAKNIAARTMSLCGAGQVLLTTAAYQAVRGRANAHTPTGTRYALAGLYAFKGISEPQPIYTVGLTTESLQPPPSTQKAQRIGGPKKVRSRLRHMRARELAVWSLYRAAFIMLTLWTAILIRWIARPSARQFWGIDHAPYTWCESIIEALHYIIRILTT